GFDSFRGDASVPEGSDPYAPAKKWAPGTGIHRTTDGGKTFKKITQGLPTCNLGRIGLSCSRKTPGMVFAIVDSEKVGMGPPQAAVGEVCMGITGEDAETGARLTAITDKGPADKAGLKAGDIVLAIDNKTILSYQQLVEQIKTHKPGDKVTVKLS